MLGAVLTIKICIIPGSCPQHLISDLDLFLPLFVPCLMVGTLLRNLQQQGEFPGFRSSSRTPGPALFAEISKRAFLTMSLMALPI